jgi:hypothetical protein
MDAELGELVERQRMYRARQSGAPPPDAGRLEDAMRRYLAEALLTLRLLAPDLVIVWNGTFAARALYALAADQLKVPKVFAEKGLLPESFYFDGRGINAASDLARMDEIPEPDGDELRRFRELIDALDRGGASGWEQPRRRDLNELRDKLGIPSGRCVVFFPAQVDHDSNLICFSPHFPDTAAVLRWLGSGLDPERHVVVAKPHPKGRLTAADMRKALGAGGIVVEDVNILDAIALSDCVVSINSGVAFEAAIRESPIVLLGDGLLSGRGFAVRYQGETAAELVDRAIAQHAAHGCRHHTEALRMGTFLMFHNYAFRGDVPATERALRRHLPPTPVAPADRLLLAEVVPLVRAIDADDILGRFSGRTLMTLAMRKLVRRAGGRLRG